MTPERWARIEQIFQYAAETNIDGRGAFLEEACAGDEELRREVESLLAQLEVSANPLGDAVSKAIKSFSPDHDTRNGGHIGPYRITGIIGQGGMGTVYRANRDDDQFKMQVAIKVVKRGMDTDHVISRFVQERQILARLEHPNIARLLEGGTTEDGLPYFVMEYIEGETITDYCKNKRLSIPERLNLFREVCFAVQHAHQRLIIHRDIKPANLLVTPDGTPKLLDFGIAKLLNPDPALEMPTATMTIFRLMTPDYASPEQVKGLPISTATDVYSLGAVLYEMLTEQRPHQLKNYTPTEIERVICLQETEKPSAAAARSTSVPAKLSRMLMGDLDNIVLMSMRKEPERRYQSAGQVAEDIDRFLRNFPVLARPDTLMYRTGKFMTRNKLPLITLAIVILSLLGGIMVALHQARIAQRRFQEVRQLANSFLFDVHDKIKDLPGSTPAREIVVSTALKYLDRLSKEAPGEPDLQWELAEAYEKVADIQGDPRGGNLGHPQAAIESYAKALKLIQELHNRNPQDLRIHRSLASCLYKLGDLKVEMGDITGGIAILREAVNEADAIHPKAPKNRDDLLLNIRTQRVLGDAELKARNPAETLRIERRALELSEKMVTEYPDDLSRHHLTFTLIRLGEAQIETGDLPAGIKTYEQALQIRSELVKKNPSDPYMRRELRVLHIWLGNHYGGTDTFNLGDTRKAEEYYRKALTIAEQLAQEDSSNAAFQYDLSICYAKIGQILAESNPSESLQFYKKAIAINDNLMAASPGEFRFQSRKALYSRWISIPLMRMGDVRGAIETLQESVATLRSITQQNPKNDEVLSGMHDSTLALAEALLQSGDFENARIHYQNALEISLKQTEQHPSDLYAKWRLAESYSGLGKYFQMLAEIPDSNHDERLKNWMEARQWYQKNHAIWEGWKESAVSTVFDLTRTVHAMENLAMCDAKITALNLE